MELELRKKIFTLVSKNAGSHLRELERKSKIPYSTLKYHLNFLSKHDLIIEKKSRGKIKYYPKKIESEDMEIIGILRQKNFRKILLYLLINDNCTFGDIEQFIKLSPSTVSWYLKKLINVKAINKINLGKKFVYVLVYDKKKIMKVLITYRESFVDSLIDKTIEMWELN